MNREDEKPKGLTRERLVEGGLALIADDGLDALSMRALADRLDVKAASLYWHVRDRRELLELLADAVLDGVRPRRGRNAWRDGVIAVAAAIAARIATQRDGARLLLEVPDAVVRSDVFGELRRDLESAGLGRLEAAEVARMVIVHVVSGAAPSDQPQLKLGAAASIAIDSGSRGVFVRAGNDMEGLVRTPRDRSAAAPAIVRGEAVVVRRLRGTGRGEIELNPAHPWSFRIQGPTWNTVLDVGGLDVRAIKLDGGAARVECFLAEPQGVVPIEVSGGVVGVVLHRPRGTAAAADISSGAVRLKLDGHSIKASVTDSQWESGEGASRARDRYQLRISGGAVQVTLEPDAGPPKHAREDTPAPAPGRAASALEILLDGVESRVKARS